MQSVTADPIQAAPAAPDAQPLLDLRHLDHQTLGDKALRSEVLQLFLDEAGKYCADLQSADECKTWRMALHTLKGVSLNLGAFRLAQLCRQFECTTASGLHPRRREGATAIAVLLDETVVAIRAALPPSTPPSTLPRA
jgi:HPt (histidine-containing phosphotransfer) domain-containing protein